MWPTMNAKYPQEDTPESLEGNAAHWVAWEMHAGRFHDVGSKIPIGGQIVTEEMIEGAELLLETIAARIPAGLPVNVERSVAIPRIHKDCWGTPDVWAFGNAKLEVLDYKFGHGFVDEYENQQGIGYIAGILDELAASLGMPLYELEQCIDISFTIVQPRCFYKGAPVRTWTMRGVDLRGHINKLENAANLARPILGDIPVATTNPECDNCPGSHACAALQLAAYRDCEVAVKSLPVELPPEAAALELRMMERSLERLTARVEGLRESVTAEIRRGANVKWYRVEQGYGQRRWTVPNEQVISMGALMGVKLDKVAVVTPLQAIKSGIDEAVIKAYSDTPLGKLKLTLENPSDARRVFGNNQG